MSAHRYGSKDHRALRLIAAVAILAIAIAGCSIALTSEESEAAGEKWSVASKEGAIINGSIDPADPESTDLEHTITIMAAEGCFVPVKNAAANDEVQLDGNQTGVTGAQVVPGSYTPDDDRLTATVKVKVTAVTADHAKVYIKCTCVKPATVNFKANITGPPAVAPMKIAPGADCEIELAGDMVAYTGHDIKTAKLTKGATTQSVNVTTNADGSIELTIPAKYLVANEAMEVQLNYTLHVYKVTAGSLYNLTFKTKGTCEYNTEVVITIEGTTGYHAPAKPSGIDVKGGSVYTYSYSGEGNNIIGTVTIPKITTDVTINGAADGNTYKVTYMADALDVGKVPVRFKPEFHTYTYGSIMYLPTKPSDQINHLELTFIECIDGKGNKIEYIPASEKHLGDFTVSILVEDNMDYADYTPRNITIALGIIAAVVLAIVMVVMRR